MSDEIIVTRGQRIEATFAGLALRLFMALPRARASAVGGWLARLIGPRLGITKRARRNLAQALPGLDRTAQDRVITEMWDNLGRVVGEFPHLKTMDAFTPGAAIEAEGLEHVDAAIARGKPLIFYSGHFGNWEVAALAAALYGMKLAAVYRAANNPLVDRMMIALRRDLGADPIPKGPQGARKILSAIRAGQSLCMLVDQKMNDGIAVPFFGRDAMTAPAIAELALRFDATVLPARVERLPGARFRVTVFPPHALPASGDRAADVLTLMTAINRTLEEWIRAKPGHWFWLHRRWPDS
ncbi:lipid A biosynthesis lauroyl acyltransferase [Aliidongia dinghuensis]|uniref:Lipid A biosynthesis lauroyl acyltransferase n=1 Tax=Aliidongia dinghuensis TaxID=1867774 RepID=A0A8J3E3G0_9PROT|nr:lysophospholipid acyltransferase family protein [Aliidongia dinghuensis]GGF16108.1 lipid A biosynthesis lauroyl acyltransferase [Aliidongia dinghuensis]